MRRCLVCDVSPARIGLLCPPCASPIDVSDGICPEQIVSRFSRASGAYLIDRWGNPHTLAEHTIVGRSAEFGIHAACISRKHALIEKSASDWLISDLNSRNGTFVNTHPIRSACSLEVGDQLNFGPVGLLFVTGAAELLGQELTEYATRSTIRGPSQRSSEDQRIAELDLSLIEPTRGGGGVLVVGGKETRLTLMQFALVRILVDRMLEDADQPPVVRGFVPSIELLASLPWSTDTPDDVNLKQLVRRLRDRLSELGLSIEGRYGFGYRLQG